MMIVVMYVGVSFSGAGGSGGDVIRKIGRLYTLINDET